MNELLTAVGIAVGVLVVIGLLCAVILVVAAKFFAVKVDEREQNIRACLPGANCGACGFTGCDGYAHALATDPETKANLCVPGGESAAKQLGDVMGVEVEAVAKQVAFVHCNGNCENTHKKHDYEGIKTCAAAKMFFGGDGECTNGCLGYGDCAKVCAYGAISWDNGIAKVDPALCTGCGQCAKACPNFVIRLVPADAGTVVTCNNKDKGAVARKKCTNACIGCKKCELNCPTGAIAVKDNLAQIDYSKCVGCIACSELCPQHTIKRVDFAECAKNA